MNKSSKITLAIFLLTFLGIHTACKHSEGNPHLELYEHLEIQFEVNTLEPEIGQSSVTLNANITKTLSEQRLEYGFIWVANTDKNAMCPDPTEVNTLIVDEGIYKGEYSISWDEFPRGQEISIYAYLRQPGHARILVAGDPVFFNW